jgi:hypothetical protein
MKVIKSFELLKQSFIRTTVPANIMAFNKDLEGRIQAYNNLDTQADPSQQVNDLALQDGHTLNPIFSKYVEDGQKFFEANPNQELAEKYHLAIEDYLLMKNKQRQEMSIMEANRVGVDKNLANIVSATAKVCGLSMPIEYKHTDRD